MLLMKRFYLFAGATVFVVAVATIAGFLAFHKPVASHADSCLEYGAFGHSVAFIEAQKQGFFTQEGLSVCYNQVSGSQQQINSLLSGQYQFAASTADNSLNGFVNNNQPLQVVAGGDQGSHLDLFVNTANGINSISDLQGKTVAVDAPNSGFVLATEKILSANGLQPGSYSLQVIGGSLQRLQALEAGVDSAGVPVYATILAEPFTAQAQADSTLKDVASFSNYLSPYQGTSLTVSRTYAQANPTTVEKFIAALILGNRYANDPMNKSAVVANIASTNNISTSLATEVYTDSLNSVTGENIDESVNTQGLYNTAVLRQSESGFNTSVNIGTLVTSGTNNVYDQEYWNAALGIANAATNSFPFYNIKNDFSGKGLDDTNYSTSNGTLVQQWTLATDQVNQEWSFASAGDGFYYIRNRYSGKVLDVTNQSTANGAQIQQWDEVGNHANQEWSLVPVAGVSNGYYIVNRLSGKVLDDTNLSTSNGTIMQQWTEQPGQTNQIWIMQKI
jgi:ABC-type nitrate/sulfonate/bicarbonate transport system substrate-binding protein